MNKVSKIKTNNRNKPTLKNIADMLSVAPSTVSKALRDSTDVSYEMKMKVLKLAKELNYRPNRLAQSLISKESKILGVLIPDLRIPFFSEAARGMYEEAASKGYEAIIMVHDEKIENEKKKLEFMSDIHVDGILLNAASNQNIDIYKSMEDEGIKCVCWDRRVEGLDCSSIAIDDIKASYELTSQIIKEGRRKILYFGKNQEISVVEDRYKGYVKALEESEIEIDDNLVVYTKRNYDDAYSKMKYLIESNNEFDAVICIGGLVAYGAGSAIKDANLSVPEDIILGEFGDNEILSRLGIPFYTVCQNPYTMGKTAVDLLIKELENRDKNKAEHIIIESRVLYRNFQNSHEGNKFLISSS